MTPNQIAAVQASWEAIAAHAEAIARTFFSRLFANDQRVAYRFDQSNMELHRTQFISTLDQLVRSLDDPDHLVAIAGALGRRHTGYHVEERHFDSFREALLEVLEPGLGPRFTSELRSAWTEAYALVASLMVRAMRHEAAASANTL
jgi:hemoglobin-like flavoprotein